MAALSLSDTSAYRGANVRGIPKAGARGSSPPAKGGQAERQSGTYRWGGGGPGMESIDSNAAGVCSIE